MLELLRPNLYVESFHHIDFNYLKEQGIKAICSDLDNTLVAWESEQANPELLAWLKKARDAGFELYLISNAVPKRFEHFTHLLGVKGISKAGKPRKRAFLQALRELGRPAEQVALVGDQIFTDVLGGNRVGLFTILVVPLSKREFIGTRFMRRIERIVMRWLSLKRP
ncbi:MAG TPA: YqeG family HAD IIIA-type phosphatase [Firmicutes bacterium]|nr:YqeG family HAD IIIA-type phosphatase [Bacillota bacterium]